MADFRLVAARKLVWDKEAWRKPALLWLTTCTLQEMLESETLSSEALAEIEMLLKKLRLAGKIP